MLTKEEYYNNSLILPPECDVLCTFRHCYSKGEESNPGKPYAAFKPACMTRLAYDCPPWRNKPGDEADLPRALNVSLNLIKMHQSARSAKDKAARQRGYELIEAVAKLLHTMRKDK